MRFAINKYYKYTLRSVFLSKYDYLNYFQIINCTTFVISSLRKGKSKLSTLVAAFFFYYLVGFFGFISQKHNKRKLSSEGVYFSILNYYKYFLIFSFFRKRNIYSFLSSANLNKYYCNFTYKLIVENSLYLIKKPKLRIEPFMFYDIFLTNNIKLIYTLILSDNNKLKQIDLINQFLF